MRFSIPQAKQCSSAARVTPFTWSRSSSPRQPSFRRERAPSVAVVPSSSSKSRSDQTSYAKARQTSENTLKLKTSNYSIQYRWTTLFQSILLCRMDSNLGFIFKASLCSIVAHSAHSLHGRPTLRTNLDVAGNGPSSKLA